jgi:type I restriction enzyme S subunit
MQLASGPTGPRNQLSPTDRLRASKVLVPPLAEQRAVTEHIAQVNSAIPRLIAKIEMQIVTLNEFRSALITNAVTGKIDVCNVAKNKAVA